MTRLFLVLVSIAWCSSSFAQNSVEAKHVKVSLLSENKSITGATPFDVGVHFRLEKGWHVYWFNPGDSGEPPRVSWTLPAGLSAGSFQWPLPEKILTGPLADYGYSQEVLLITTMTPSQKLTKLDLGAEVKWLVCREICIPGKAKLSLNLQIGKAAYSEHRVLFEATRSALPHSLPSEIQISASHSGDNFEIKVQSPNSIRTASFFPSHTLEIDNPSAQNWNGQVLHIKKSEQMAQWPTQLEGVLALDSKGYSVNLPLTSSNVSLQTLLSMLLFAFIGGVLLNLMPCVFPVLSMKVFGFLKMSGSEKGKLRGHAWAYTFGILVSFWVLVGVLVALKVGGQKLGWGFQLQSPSFVASLATVLFLFGLSLVGVFEISGAFTGAGSRLARKEGALGAFFTGVLATLVSTPCTAPFMGSAVGFALSQSTATTFLIFTAIALGLALPYLLLSYVPFLGTLLPKPGPWMETLKQVTGFLVFATVVWLLSVLAVQAPVSFLVFVFASLLFVGLASWIFRRWGQSAIGRAVAFLFLIGALCLNFSPMEKTGANGPHGQMTTKDGKGLEWQPYSEESLNKLRSEGRNVFVDFTAAWCISCKVNELLVFGSDDVIKRLKDKNVVLVKADWTSHDETITQALSALGRSGVPTYVIYKGNGKEPILLPELITPALVIEALDRL